MNDILLLVREIGDQLLDSMDLHLFAHEWKVIMEVVKVTVIGYIKLQEIGYIKLLL